MATFFKFHAAASNAVPNSAGIWYKWFSLIADETRDLSGKEQLSLCIHWVDRHYEVHEDFIGFA